QTTLSWWRDGDVVVRRRFSEFALLHRALTAVFAGVLVPPLPSKKPLKWGIVFFLHSFFFFFFFFFCVVFSRSVLWLLSGLLKRMRPGVGRQVPERVHRAATARAGALHSPRTDASG